MNVQSLLFRYQCSATSPDYGHQAGSTGLRLGNWEGDTVIGKRHQGALMTLVERKSLDTVIRAMRRKTAEDVRKAVICGLTLYMDRVHTIT